jgi:hypothetical protein
VPSLAEFVALRTAIVTHPGFVSGMDVIHDHSGLSGYLPSTDVRALAERTARLLNVAPFWGRLAIVAPDPAVFGLVRMWESYASEELAARARVFASLDEAYDWLKQLPPAR